MKEKLPNRNAARQARFRQRNRHLFVEYHAPESLNGERRVEEMSPRLSVAHARAEELVKAFANFAALLRNGNIPESALEPVIKTIDRTWPVVHDSRTEKSLAARVLVDALESVRRPLSLSRLNAEPFVRGELRRVAPNSEKRTKSEDLNEAIGAWQTGTQSERVEALEKLLKKIGIYIKDGLSLMRQARRKRRNRTTS